MLIWRPSGGHAHLEAIAIWVAHLEAMPIWRPLPSGFAHLEAMGQSPRGVGTSALPPAGPLALRPFVMGCMHRSSACIAAQPADPVDAR